MGASMSGKAHTTIQNDPVAEQNSQPRPEGRFAGKVALVTGASDRGIGGAIAERLCREGAAVALVSRSQPERLFKRLDRLKARYSWIPCDVTRAKEVARTVSGCQAEFGRLDVVVNNAGIETAQAFDKMSDEDWHALVEVNLNGAARVTRAALPHLRSPGGVIVNIASALALGGCAGFSAYSAAKAGLVGFTQSLAWELAPRGIRVVCVAPAMVNTPMIRKHIKHLTPETWRQVEAVHPLGMGLPHDVAAAVAFLASSDARWITGVTLPLGWTPTYALPVAQFLD
jgi:3-oxoacyl-[acyl-carrier protein] reductase